MKGTVRIGGIPYKIKMCDTWKDVGHDDMAEMLHAEISFLDHSIHVRTDAPKELQVRAFIHEVVHGIIAEYSIRELCDDENGEHYETAVDQLAVGFSEALQSLGVDLHKHLPQGRGRRG